MIRSRCFRRPAIALIVGAASMLACAAAAVPATMAAAAAATTTEQSGVEVKRHRAAHVRTFNPDHPPADMPALKPPEAAVTVSEFSCSAQVSVVITETREQGGKTFAKARIQSIKMDLGLNITQWLPSNATRKIRLHENAHQAISDHYFDLGPQAARALAEPYIGRTIEGSAASKDGAAATDAAVDAAIKATIRQIASNYMARIEARAGNAQERFDELTDHGRNDVKEETAVRQAIEQASGDEG